MMIPKFTMTFWKAVAVVILAAGAVATIVRFGMGLGASTNLTDLRLPRSSTSSISRGSSLSFVPRS